MGALSQIIPTDCQRHSVFLQAAGVKYFCFFRLINPKTWTLSATSGVDDFWVSEYDLEDLEALKNDAKDSTFSSFFSRLSTAIHSPEDISISLGIDGSLNLMADCKSSYPIMFDIEEASNSNMKEAYSYMVFDLMKERFSSDKEAVVVKPEVNPQRIQELERELQKCKDDLSHFKVLCGQYEENNTDNSPAIKKKQPDMKRKEGFSLVNPNSRRVKAKGIKFGVKK